MRATKGELFICFSVVFAIAAAVPHSDPFSEVEIDDDPDDFLGDEFEIPTKWPIILVPGLSGSRIEAKLNKSEVVSLKCAKKSDWFLIWLSLTQILWAIQCFFDNFRLVFNEETGRTENPTGVETRVPDFGGTSSIEYLTQYSLSRSKLIHL